MAKSRVELDDAGLLRYSRQIMLPEIDVAGQEMLLNSRVLVLGLGGLGSPVALYLAAAGVGELWLADDDEVDVSNLQRQVVHAEHSVGLSKVASAIKTLKDLNSQTVFKAIEQRLEGAALHDCVSQVDLVVDCTDNFKTRFSLNRMSVATKTPLVSGAAIRFDGQVSVYDPRDAASPCYQCLYDETDDERLTCSESGVISPLVGIIGSVQALEAVKLLTGVGRSLQGRLLLLDGRRMEWREMKLSKDPACPVCSLPQATHTD